MKKKQQKIQDTMKKNIFSLSLLVTIATIALLFSCESNQNQDPLASIAKKIHFGQIEVSNIKFSSATVNCSFMQDEGIVVTTQGYYYGTDTNLIYHGIKTQNGYDSITISDLTPGQQYYIIAYAKIDDYTLTGTRQMFTTKQSSMPSITLNEISDIKIITATADYQITEDGGADVSSHGICWSYTPNPTINDKTATKVTSNFTAHLTSLQENTTYYVRAWATNELGTSYSNEISFITKKRIEGTLTDIDSNTYKWVEIGTQTWMAENLAVTHYNDGTEIPHIANDSAWSRLYTPAYCWYDNSETTYKDNYGALYNWYVVNTGKMCPTGWHVPTDEEWTELKDYLIANRYAYSGSIYDGKIAKSLAAKSGWKNSPSSGEIGNDMGSNNSTGFTALPGGFRYSNDGSFGLEGRWGVWWTSTGHNSSNVWKRALYWDYDYLDNNVYHKQAGLSIRCVKD